MWQNLKYELYPKHPTLIEKENKELALLPKPDFKFPAGGWTNILVQKFGWKITKKIKIVLRK